MERLHGVWFVVRLVDGTSFRPGIFIASDLFGIASPGLKYIFVQVSHEDAWECLLVKREVRKISGVQWQTDHSR